MFSKDGLHFEYIWRMYIKIWSVHATTITMSVGQHFKDNWMNLAIKNPCQEQAMQATFVVHMMNSVCSPSCQSTGSSAHALQPSSSSFTCATRSYAFCSYERVLVADKAVCKFLSPLSTNLVTHTITRTTFCDPHAFNYFIQSYNRKPHTNNIIYPSFILFNNHVNKTWKILKIFV